MILLQRYKTKSKTQGLGLRFHYHANAFAITKEKGLRKMFLSIAFAEKQIETGRWYKH
jgi:hypothetical protein